MWTGYTSAAQPRGPRLRLDDEVVAARRARWGIVLAGGLQALGIGLLVIVVSRGLVVGRMVIDGTTESIPDRDVILFMASGLLSSALAVPAYVVLALLLIWVHRVVANGMALGHRGPRDAVIAVVSFFIPVLGWWWPYQSLRDAVPESATEARRALLRWWVVWVLSPLVSLPALALAFFSTAAAAVAVVAWVGALIVGVALGRRAIELITACHVEEGRGFESV